MKTVLITLITLFSCFNSVRSQLVFPERSTNPTWNVYHSFWYDFVTDIYQYTYDTNFCGFQYTKITCTPSIFGGLTSGYVRQDNDKVYIRLNNDCLAKEFTMYDFSMNVGDTVVCGYETGDSTKFWLTQIDTVNYFGINRQRYIMKFYMGPPVWGDVAWMYWVKGIGSTRNPFYTLVCLNEGCESGYELLCYDSTGIQLYQSPSLGVCDTTNLPTGEDQIMPGELSVYPNPFNKNIIIHLEINSREILVAELYSQEGTFIDGRKLSNSTITEFILPENLASGVYFLKIYSGTKSSVHKIIKI